MCFKHCFKKSLIWLLHCLVLLIPFTHSYAASSNLTNFANIEHLYQDQQGYIWLAGQFGLIRYDGNEFINFSSNSNHWPMPFSWIHEVVQYQNKLLLTTESNGLWWLDLHNYQPTKLNLPERAKTMYYSIFFKGNIYSYDMVNKTLWQYQLADQKAKIALNNIELNELENSSQYIYLQTPYGVNQYQPNQTFTPQQIMPERVESLVVDQHMVYGCNANHLFIFNEKTKQLITKTLSQGCSNLLLENEQRLLIATLAGELQGFDLTQQHIAPSPYNATGLNNVNQLMMDKSGMIWAKSSQGIKFIRQDNKTDYPINFNVAINAIALANYQQQLWLASYGAGLAIFTPEQKTHYLAQKQFNHQLKTQGSRINNVLMVDDTLYLATFDGVWQLKNNQLSKLPFVGNNQIFLQIKHDDRYLYLCADNDGIYIYDYVQNSLVKHIKDQPLLSANEVLDVHPLANQSLWVATSAGIDILWLTNNNHKTIDLPGASKAVSIIEHQNKMFVATMGDGIFVFDKQAQLIARFAIGINFSYMKLIDNVLWAPASPGLYQINTKHYQASLVPNTEQYSFTNAPEKLNNTLYAPHYGGVLAMPLAKPAPFHPRVLITKTMVSGQPAIVEKMIKLNSANDVVTLNLASLDYRQGTKKQYQYRINNGKWNNINGAQLTLTGLASGLYHLEVKATNSLGQWSSHHAYADIQVAYPWYWTPQIRIVYIMLLLSFIGYILWLLYLRSSSIKTIHQILQADVKARGKVALNIIQYLQLAKTKLSNSQQNIPEAIKLINQSIAELQSSQCDDEPSSLMGNNLCTALPYLFDYLLKKYHVDIQQYIHINDDNLSEEMQADIYKIIYEAISSAIRAGESRKFSVQMKEFKQKIWLTIEEDAGTFLHYDSKIHFNIAMYYIRQIAEKYNAIIHTYQEQDKGSQLVISIPLMAELLPHSQIK